MEKFFQIENYVVGLATFTFLQQKEKKPFGFTQQKIEATNRNIYFIPEKLNIFYTQQNKEFKLEPRK